MKKCHRFYLVLYLTRKLHFIQRRTQNATDESQIRNKLELSLQMSTKQVSIHWDRINCILLDTIFIFMDKNYLRC